MSERDKRAEGYNLKEDTGLLKDPSTVNTLRVSWKCYKLYSKMVKKSILRLDD